MKTRIQAGALSWLDVTDDPEGRWVQTNVPWGPRNLIIEHHDDNSYVVDIPLGDGFQLSSHINRAGHHVIEIEAHEGDNAIVRLTTENVDDFVRLRSAFAGLRVPRLDPRVLPEVTVDSGSTPKAVETGAEK